MRLFFSRKNEKDRDDGFEIADETEPEEEQVLLSFHPMPEGVNVPKQKTNGRKSAK